MKILPGTWITPLFLMVCCHFNSMASGQFTDFQEQREIGITGGTLMVEDPETGKTVVLEIPGGALHNNTVITLIMRDVSYNRVLGKTHMGISVLPADVFLLEKATLEVYNPPVDVTRRMLLHQLVNPGFMIPLDSQQISEDENRISGSFYITGDFGLGTPTSQEAAAQSKKLDSFDPAGSLAYMPGAYESGMEGKYPVPGNAVSNGPRDRSVGLHMPSVNPVFRCRNGDEECLRWQKVLTKVGGALSWVDYYIMTGNTSGEQAERRNARRALEEAIDDYLGQSPPAYRCGRYIKAAAKYLEACILLGVDPGYESRIRDHFEQLVDVCSFVFTVEAREWINHPEEKHDDGSTTMEKMNRYSIIKCHVPWNEFLVSGRMEVRGEGNMNLHHENHWIGGEENTHERTDANWDVTGIEGSIRMNYDESGMAHPTANITIHWDGTAESRTWGKRHGNQPYDYSGSEDRSFTEYKTYPVVNGYSEKLGDQSFGLSLTVYILNQPGYDRDDPNDCF